MLELIRDEGADLVIHLGDFDYQDDPEAWDAMISRVLGEDFPLLAVIGNHDEAEWDGYSRLLRQRLERAPAASCEGEYGINAACHFEGLLFILSGAGTRGDDHTRFIRDTLSSDSAIWRVCAWHKNQKRMQVSGKSNSTGWGPYEACRLGSAMIANGHAHGYQRTQTLRDMSQQVSDPEWLNPDELRVGNGSSFAVVSGLGGHSLDVQRRCHPSQPPYGCSFEWASIYTGTQGATYGALFIDFHVDGDPRKAMGYFKNIEGEVIDAFEIVSQAP